MRRRRRRTREVGIGAAESRPRETGWGWRIQVVSAFLAIVGFAFLVGSKVEGFFDGETEVRLEVAEVAVANGPADFDTVGDGEVVQVAATKPRIEATVRNLGEETAWVEEARVTVLDSARFRPCISQGGGPEVPRSKPYEVTLPDFPTLGRRVLRRDLHVEVQPGHGARPVLSLLNTGVERTNLYALRVEFVAGPGSHVLPVGRFVVGVPEPPDRGGAILPERDEVLLSPVTRPGHTGTSSCFRHNLTGVRRLLSAPGRRSSYLKALARFQVAPSWTSYASHRSPQAEVAELFEEASPVSAIYAVEVAERTGNAAFEERVRERAVEWLLRLAREDLEDDFPGGAAEAAHYVLSLERSPEAKRLLVQAEAAERAEEEA
jgi:hypothetical protein